MGRPSLTPGAPAPGAQDNGYTNAAGQVTLDIVPGMIQGSLLVSVEDGQGNTSMQSIPVSAVNSSKPGR